MSVCDECGSRLAGRADRRYCDHKCRNRASARRTRAAGKAAGMLAGVDQDDALARLRDDESFAELFRGLADKAFEGVEQVRPPCLPEYGDADDIAGVEHDMPGGYTVEDGPSSLPGSADIEDAADSGNWQPMIDAAVRDMRRAFKDAGFDYRPHVTRPEVAELWSEESEPMPAPALPVGNRKTSDPQLAGWAARCQGRSPVISEGS